MSSAVISTSAAQGRFFIFDDESAPDVSCHPERSEKCEKHISRGVEGSLAFNDSRLAHITPASQLEIRPAAEMASSGIAALDALTGGLPRGCITEICGPASSGRTSLLLAALAAATHRGECCVLIDAGDALDPYSVDSAGTDLDRLLWVRCGDASIPKRPRKSPPSPQRTRQEWGTRTRAHQSEHCLEQVLRATDLLLESGGFGVIALDLADVPRESARRIPLTTWFRFRRAIEHTPTILLVIEPQPIAGSCSSLLLQLGAPSIQYPAPSSKPSHSHLLTGLEITVELIRSRLDRKPARSVSFETRTAWAG
jgi:hypothetical protein